MARYDCTKAKDFLHEAARVKAECGTAGILCSECPLFVKSPQSLCDCCIVDSPITGEKFLNYSENEFSDIVEKMQKWSDEHIKRKELTGDELAVLVALKILGYKYIAADQSGMIYAYETKPEKFTNSCCWNVDLNTHKIHNIEISQHGLFKDIVDYSDEEPAEIEKLLKGMK